MRPEAIVNVTPVVVQDASLEDRIEDLAGEEFVAGIAVEALHEGVLPGTPGLEVGGPGAGEAASTLIAAATTSGPLSQRMKVGAPRWPRASSRTMTTSSAVIERPSRRPTLSRMNSFAHRQHLERPTLGSGVEEKEKGKA